jgi:uncharacterized protein YdaU (DUF1376 family)
MASRKDPAFPLYARDWLGDPEVQCLPRELRGCLVGLWAHSWLHGPIEERHIGGLCRIIDASMEEVRQLLNLFFDPTDGGGWISLRLEKERAERQEIRSLKRSAGRKGAAERWQKDGRPMADAWQNDGRPDGKRMAEPWQPDGTPHGKRMASRWQNDGPQPTPTQPSPEDTHTGFGSDSFGSEESCTDGTRSRRAGA